MFPFDTEVCLYRNIPFSKNYEHNLFFNDKEEQSKYFIEKIDRKLLQYKYIKDEEADSINVALSRNILNRCNYLSFKNDNRTYYCFITKLKYISVNVTQIFYEIDLINTYIYDVHFNKSFIEREHISKVDDTEFNRNNAVFENLEQGIPVINGKSEVQSLKDTTPVLASTVEPSDFATVGGGKYTGLYSAVSLFAFPPDDNMVIKWVKDIADHGKEDAISNVYLVPRSFINTLSGSNEIEHSDFIHEESYDLSFNKTLDGYTPKNKKLLNYPFNYLLISNNNGASINIYYEYCMNNKVEYNIQGVVTEGINTRLVMKNYKGVTGYNHDEQINLGAFPTCNWLNNPYASYLSQNQNSLGVKGITSAIAIGGGIATGNAVAVLGGLAGIATTLAPITDLANRPLNSQGSIGGNSINGGADSNTFTLYKVSVNNEYAKIIDDYFSTYGYASNRIKYPNLKTRQYFNYVKTKSASITPNDDCYISNDDLEKLQNIFNSGITLWHDPKNILNYEVDN